ncbi:uncharacterized protein DEA37_0002558, partial [Paragonimus westermani]
FQPRAVLMPHHKGRKRLHLQLRDNLARVGSDLKTKLYQSVHATWRTIQEFALSHRFVGTQTEDVSGERNDENEDASSFSRFISRLDTQPGERDDAGSCTSEDELSFNGQLNNGRRIDFVLQEAPLESFSDYLFALGSHAAYWESEDTSLFLLTEVYSKQCAAPTALNQKLIKETPTANSICNDVLKRSPAPQPPLFSTPSNLLPVAPHAGLSAYSPNTSQLLGSSNTHLSSGIAVFSAYQQHQKWPTLPQTVPAYQLHQPTQPDVDPTQSQPFVEPTTRSTFRVDGPHSMHPSGAVPPFTPFIAPVLPPPAQFATMRHHLAHSQLPSFSTTVAGHSLGTVPVVNSPVPVGHTFPGSTP